MYPSEVSSSKFNVGLNKLARTSLNYQQFHFVYDATCTSDKYSLQIVFSPHRIPAQFPKSLQSIFFCVLFCIVVAINSAALPTFSMAFEPGQLNNSRARFVFAPVYSLMSRNSIKEFHEKMPCVLFTPAFYPWKIERYTKQASDLICLRMRNYGLPISTITHRWTHIESLFKPTHLATATFSHDESILWCTPRSGEAASGKKILINNLPSLLFPLMLLLRSQTSGR